MIQFSKTLIAAAASFLVVSLPTAFADESIINDAIDNAIDNNIVLSSYHVSTDVNSRLATTSIDMIFENYEDCTSAYSMTIQLPVNARVTDLVMDLSDGCQMDSQVKDLDDAVEDFEEFLGDGKAAAILTAWDMSNYGLQVSIPPNGSTSVTLKYQELLVQKLDVVSFQVPMFPGMAVDDLMVDISVEDPNLVNGFETDLQDQSIFTSLDGGKASMHYETIKVTEDTDLPTLFRANFQPGHPPEEGLFLTNGECFTHIFNPTQFLSSVGFMARRIVFVIDVSGSMSGQKLEDVKASFVLMIETLEEQDTLILQTFSNEGTESQWGPKPATAQNKRDAEKFVQALRTMGGTNLNDAFLDGITNARDAPETVASVVVIMTDGRGSKPANEVARNVREHNEGKQVKIFSLAFGNNADMDLLLGIAIQNGGRAVRIYEGFGDAADQMELFYKQELGSILMSDINVSYDSGDFAIYDSTTSTFPFLAVGSEIVVRGKLDATATADATSRSLKSIVSANSAKGPFELPVDYTIVPNDDVNNDCSQSFAQARIVELLEYRDAARYIGDEFFVDTTVSSTPNLNASYFEEEARNIALDAGLVWPGLTALITIESPNCQQNISDVCTSGNGPSGGRDDLSAEEADRSSIAANMGYTTKTGAQAGQAVQPDLSSSLGQPIQWSSGAQSIWSQLASSTSFVMFASSLIMVMLFV